MKRGRRIVLASGIAAAVVAAAVATWYVRSGRLEERVRAELRVRLAEATRLECQIRSLRLELLRGRFELLGLQLSAPRGALRPFEVSTDAIRGRLRLRAQRIPDRRRERVEAGAGP